MGRLPNREMKIQDAKQAAANSSAINTVLFCLNRNASLAILMMYNGFFLTSLIPLFYRNKMDELRTNQESPTIPMWHNMNGWDINQELLTFNQITLLFRSGLLSLTAWKSLKRPGLPRCHCGFGGWCGEECKFRFRPRG